MDILCNLILNDDEDELFLQNSCRTYGVKRYFQLEPRSEVLTISKLWHTLSRNWSWAEPDFRLCLISAAVITSTPRCQVLFSNTKRCSSRNRFHEGINIKFCTNSKISWIIFRKIGENTSQKKNYLSQMSKKVTM